MVFYNMMYEDCEAAMRSDDHDALAVLAVVFKQKKRRNPMFAFTKKFREIVNAGYSVIHDFRSTPFSRLLPININEYFTYEGSLTTPPCSAITKWVLFKKVLPISKWQLKDFALIRNARNVTIGHNFRDVQGTNDREIFVNRQPNILKNLFSRLVSIPQFLLK